jgi:uncharacterized membrane protein
MHGSEAAHLAQIAGFLGSFYLFMAIVNGVAAFILWNGHDHERPPLFRIGPLRVPAAALCLAAALFFLLLSPIAYSGDPDWMRAISLPAAVRNTINRLMNPTVYTLGSFFLLLAVFLLRKFFVRPAVAWTLLNLGMLLMGMSLTDPNFAAIVTKPDNVPIVGLILLLGFFTWLAGWKAVQNDERRKQGLEPLEALDNEKVLVWPIPN